MGVGPPDFELTPIKVVTRPLVQGLKIEALKITSVQCSDNEKDMVVHMEVDDTLAHGGGGEFSVMGTHRELGTAG